MLCLSTGVATAVLYIGAFSLGSGSSTSCVWSVCWQLMASSSVTLGVGKARSSGLERTHRPFSLQSDSSVWRQRCLFSSVSARLALFRWVRDFRSDALSWLPEFPSVEVAALQFLVYWIIFDFFRYWWHRWMHESDLLWRFHRLHHDAESFTVLTGSRVHPIESVLSVFFVGLPMIIVGVTPVQFTALWLIRLVVDQWQHSMVPWTFGWFGRWIVFSDRASHPPLTARRALGHELRRHHAGLGSDFRHVVRGDVINESIGNVPPALIGRWLASYSIPLLGSSPPARSPRLMTDRWGSLLAG